MSTGLILGERFILIRRSGFSSVVGQGAVKCYCKQRYQNHKYYNAKDAAPQCVGVTTIHAQGEFPILNYSSHTVFYHHQFPKSGVCFFSELALTPLCSSEKKFLIGFTTLYMTKTIYFVIISLQVTESKEGNTKFTQ